MAHKDDVAAPRAARSWTQPDAYLASLARRRTARRARDSGPRTEPEAPRFVLSTLPFLALMVGLAVLAVAIFAVAWPGGGTAERAAAPQANEVGTARKGWFQDAKREFRG